MTLLPKFIKTSNEVYEFEIYLGALRIKSYKIFSSRVEIGKFCLFFSGQIEILLILSVSVTEKRFQLTMIIQIQFFSRSAHCVLEGQPKRRI